MNKSNSPSTIRVPPQYVPGQPMNPQSPQQTHTIDRVFQILRELQSVEAALKAIPASYTLTGTATRVMPSPPTAVYTGAADGEAKLADLNTLRGVVSTLIGVVRQLVVDVGGG